MGFPLYFTTYGGAALERTGVSHAAIAPYGPFATGNDRTVLLGLQNDREWQRFCTLVLGDEGLATDLICAEQRVGNSRTI